MRPRRRLAASPPLYDLADRYSRERRDYSREGRELHERSDSLLILCGGFEERWEGQRACDPEQRKMGQMWLICL